MKDNEFILKKSSSLESEGDTEIKIAIVDEVEENTGDDDRRRPPNFSYRVFSRTTETKPPVAKITTIHSSMRIAGEAIRRTLLKVKSTTIKDQGSEICRRCTGGQICFVIICILLLLSLLILATVQWYSLRREQWIRQHQCVSPLCLIAAGQLHSKMNKSMSPCENFYQYACGEHFHPHHPSVKPDTPSAQGADAYRRRYDEGIIMHLNQEKWNTLIRIHRPAIDHLTEININAVIQGLTNVYENQWSKTNSAKYKIAKWFFSCTDKSFRNWFSVRTFMRNAVPALGGIWLLDRSASNETGVGDENSTASWPTRMFWSNEIANGLPLTANWSWMKAVTNLQNVLHVPLFVDFRVSAKKGMTPRIFINPDRHTLYGPGQSAGWAERITKLFQLLTFEARIPFGDTEATNRIKLAVSDVQIISNHLYKILSGGYRRIQSVTLGQLGETGRHFDWKQLLSSYFSEVNYHFSDEYTIYSNDVAYLKRLSPLLDELKRNYSRPVFDRMLNNYMLWSMLDSYAWHLSYEFAAIVRRSSNLHDNPETECFTLVHEVFGTVLGAIFVENHLHDEAVDYTKNLLHYLKSGARDQVESTVWLDSQTKRKVEERIDSMKIKYTVPEIMRNEAKLDYAYRNFQVTYTYIDNLLAAIRYLRSMYNRILGGIADPVESDWLTEDVSVYDSKIGIQVVLDEVYVPLGVLQPPVYHKMYPSALNFAGFGSMIGAAIARLLGEFGATQTSSSTTDNKVTMVWTDESWSKYMNHWDCVKYQLGNDTRLYLNASEWLMRYLVDDIEEDALEVIDDSTGLAIAKRAFDRWTTEVEHAVENTTLPGEHIPRDKLFYVSFAQTFCEKLSEVDQFHRLFWGDQSVPQEVIVNHIISETPEFASTFGCAVGSQMNPVKRCSAPL